MRDYERIHLNDCRVFGFIRYILEVNIIINLTKPYNNTEIVKKQVYFQIQEIKHFTSKYKFEYLLHLYFMTATRF